MAATKLIFGRALARPSLHRSIYGALRTYTVAPTALDGATDTAHAMQEPRMSVASLAGKVDASTLKALEKRPFSFTTLTEVQSQVFKLLPELANAGLTPTSTPLPDGKGRDLLVKARTGTGKTVGFLVPAIESRLNAIDGLSKRTLTLSFAASIKQEREHLLSDETPAATKVLAQAFTKTTVGVLVISPTRELAHQIATQAQHLLATHRDMHVHLLCGGESAHEQRRLWRRQSRDVVVATPGRLLDLMQDPMFSDAFATTQTLVLDEADMLLEMGFRSDIEEIIGYLPPPEQRNTMLFSATIDPSIEGIARETLHKNHRMIDCVPPGEKNVHLRVPQFVTLVDEPADYIPHMLRLIARDQMIHRELSKVMIFAPTTKLTQFVARLLPSLAHNLPGKRDTQILELHSNKDQASRTRISSRFRNITDTPSILVTSDVSARGVDYPNVTEVIQLGIPPSKEMYVHRVGRTGRGSKDGRADLVLQSWEGGFLTWELGEMPLQHISVAEFQTQVLDTAQALDADTELSLWPESIGDKMKRAKDKSGRRRTPISKRRPFTPLFGEEQLKEAASTARDATLDDFPPSPVMSGVLGYYKGRAAMLRVRIENIQRRLAPWFNELLGLDLPVYAFKDTGKDELSGRGRASGEWSKKSRDQKGRGREDWSFKSKLRGRGRFAKDERGYGRGEKSHARSWK
ncbi:RNA helicase [Malassezia vespertilionis]|uniref:ATP-dependent RNA helicase n=1 Tax=Malassezia vespertilionis TaxID=2020962 RepID=A0A2N1JBS9_9BASI|nr:RNA helicase [Malassezia vespertilionis]PKI83982.1 Mss116p [Malassezia vespertilionis]WFD06845.1 RNA helicase [Malassezia vespertilionis]